MPSTIDGNMSIENIAKRHADLNAGVPFTKFSHIALCNSYLFCSYAYYELHTSLLADGTFDRLCKYLYDDFELLKSLGVWHVGTVILEDNLSAGTCLGIKYPEAVMDIARELIRWKDADDL